MALEDIDTFVVVMLENRSFDHMLGYLSLSGPNPALPVDGLRDDPAWRGQWTNTFQGMPYPLKPLDAKIQRIDDPPHTSETIATQMDTPPFPGSPVTGRGGFVQSYMTRRPVPGDPSLVMGYYKQDAVPVFDFLARNYTVCDRWFASLPTGTQPNRLMAMSGESKIVDNAAVFLPRQQLVYDWLTDHRVPWCAYQSGDFLPFFSLMPSWLPEIVSSLTLAGQGAKPRFRRYARFREHWLSADPMPKVIFIEPEYTDGPHITANDDHPPTGIAKGQLFLADLYQALTANPARWLNTALVITYDEHGGFFDHAAPLAIPANVGGVGFDTTGVRVPALLVSPRITAGVFSDPLDHTSILQLLADRFNGGQGYSAAVAARQSRLGRIATALGPVRDGPIPAISPAILAPLKALAEPAWDSAHVSRSNLQAQAFDNVALKALQDHPELLREPQWNALTTYLGRFGRA